MLRVLFFISLLFPPLAAPLQAQTGMRTVAQLNESQYGSLRTALRTGRNARQSIRQFIPFFEVPAQVTEISVCRITTFGMQCRNERRGERCPSTVQVAIPGEQPLDLPVTCQGPDGLGNCECEFTSG